MLHFIFLHYQLNHLLKLVICDDWPRTDGTSPNFGCERTGTVLPLDTSMTLTDSAMCKQKCEEAMMETGEIRNDTGCCWLKSGEGCSLKERSKAIHGGTAIAMTCRKGKKKIRAVVNTNLSYHIYTYGKVKRIFLVF